MAGRAQPACVHQLSYLRAPHPDAPISRAPAQCCPGNDPPLAVLDRPKPLPRLQMVGDTSRDRRWLEWTDA